jgi:hypothetical protein
MSITTWILPGSLGMNWHNWQVMASAGYHWKEWDDGGSKSTGCVRRGSFYSRQILVDAKKELSGRLAAKTYRPLILEGTPPPIHLN